MKTFLIKNSQKLFIASIIFILSLSFLLFAAKYNTAKAGNPGVNKVTGFADYQMVSNVSYQTFEENIEKKLREGWSLVGGISVIYESFNAYGQLDVNSKTRPLYIQAMAR